MTEMFILGLALFGKHYIADFPWQTPYMYKNKGKWFHPGGIYHSLIHAFFTFNILYVWDMLFGYGNITSNIPFLFGIVITEFIVHYVTDLGKVKTCDSRGWSSPGKDAYGKDCLCIYTDKWFYALGVDQFIHYVTYLWIIVLAMGGF